MFKEILLAAITAIGLLSISAHAEMKYNRVGAWQVGVGTNNQGYAMCSAGIMGSQRSFWMKAQSDTAGVLFLHITKQGWQIPAGQRNEVQLQVDNAPPMALHGFGLANVVGEGWDGFEVDISTTDVWSVTGKGMIRELVNLLESGQQVKFFFPAGNEAPWIGTLDGSAAALSQMTGCLSMLFQAPSPAPTQPFSAPTTQPFSPPATQPSRSNKQL
jgi:hypothetical protein